jgi:hypothetical protein
MRKLIQLRVGPFALTPCGLLQKADPKSEIQNPKSTSAGFCSDRSKNPVATAPGSDLANAVRWRPATNYEQTATNHERAVRRQLFDDIMNEICGVMGIFLIRRGFPETTRFSRNCASFLITRGLPGGNEKRGVSE